VGIAFLVGDELFAFGFAVEMEAGCFCVRGVQAETHFRAAKRGSEGLSVFSFV
jgi:hypothetical protein